MTRRQIRYTLALAVAAGGLSLAGGAHAQGRVLETQRGFSNLGSDWVLGISAFNVGLVPQSEGGVSLGESAILHTGAAAEVGFDSNVFFDNTNPTSAPLMRLTPFLELTNVGRGRSGTPSIVYDLGAFLTFREFFSDDPQVTAQRAFNPVLGGMVEFGHGQNLTFTLRDQFVRFQDPPYGASTGNISRIQNFGSAVLQWTPGGGRLQTMLVYNNNLLLFETDSARFGNNMGHEGVLDVSWRWLPKTSLFLQGAVGYIDYFNPDQEITSLRSDNVPIRVLTGLRGLLTDKLSLYLGAGYTTTFFDRLVSAPSGLANLATVAELNYQPTPISSVVLGYRRELRNSPVLGQFMQVDAIYLQLRQMVASRLLVTGFARYEDRDFRGLPAGATRNDDLIQGGVLLDFFIQRWLFLGASYMGVFNRSDAVPTGPGLDFNKHLVLGRLGLTY